MEAGPKHKKKQKCNMHTLDLRLLWYVPNMSAYEFKNMIRYILYFLGIPIVQMYQ